MDPLRPIESLDGLIGEEVHLEDTVRELSSVVRELRPSLVGAIQVVCLDESARDCCDVCQFESIEMRLVKVELDS